MHIVVENTSVASAKWLCVNGYSDLAYISSDDGETPIDVVLKSDSKNVDYIFLIFVSFNLLRKDWIKDALKAKSELIVKVAVEAQKTIESKRFIELLPVADVDELERSFRKSSLGDSMETLGEDFRAPFACLIENVVKFDRIDFAKKIFNGELELQLFGRDVFKFTRNVAMKYGNLDRIESILEEMELTNYFESAIYRLDSKFRKALQAGDSVDNLTVFIEQQDKLLLERSKVSVAQRDTEKITVDDDVFVEVCSNGHTHLIEWILSINPNLKSPYKIILEIANDTGNYHLMYFGLNKIKQLGEGIPVVEDDCTYLRLVIERYLGNISRDLTRQDHIDLTRVENKSLYAWKEMIDYLLENQFEDLHATFDDDGGNVLWFFERLGLSRIGESPEKIQQVLELMTMLVKYGVNPNQVCNGSTIAEVLLRSCEYSFGYPFVYLRLIEWLALELSVFVNIQFLEFSLWDDSRKTIKREFDRIKNEQKKRFAL
ncbi:hypothetical protein HK098_004243 [Nowakowskiella sp. JEL0407]|nr:hypothetical protein HK098_004243 [Nowakowskiella sp. JEL0407]